MSSSIIMSTKTSVELPRDLYSEIKKRAIEEGKTVREIIIEALSFYLSSRAEDKSKKLIELILSSEEIAGPEDYQEYDYSDIGETH